MKIVGLCGHMGSGKTTVAQAFGGLCAAEAIVVHQISFATPMKDMMKVLLRYVGLEAERHVTDPASKEARINAFGGRSTRYMLQTLGTEWGRDTVSRTLWTDIAMARLDAIKGANVVIFDDVRYDTETDAINARGGLVYMVDRPESRRYESTHPSEVIPAYNAKIRNVWVDEAAKALFDCTFPYR